MTRLGRVVTALLFYSKVQTLNGFGLPFRSSRLVKPQHRLFNVESGTSFQAHGSLEPLRASQNSFIVKEFSQYEDLEEIVNLASKPLPERPDGIVTVAKYTSARQQDCKITEDQYERIARNNPSTVFLRCFAEYENSNLVMGRVKVSIMPTFDVFYGGERVARVEGNDMDKLQEVLNMYQLLNSDLDLFSEDADNARRTDWAEGKANSNGGTPRTTARFIPGYDWNTDAGAFDEAANKVQDDWEDTYGNWLPNTEDK